MDNYGTNSKKTKRPASFLSRFLGGPAQAKAENMKKKKKKKKRDSSLAERINFGGKFGQE